MPKGVPPLSLFRTVARNRRVFERFMAAGLLDKGTLTLREREIVIDRTTARCGSEYEWGVHIAFFREKAGLSDREVAATVGDDPLAWSDRDRLLISLVDQLHDRSTVDADLWQALTQAFSDEQLIELVVLTGFYHMVSYVTNAFAVPLEPFAARFPAPASD